jgi:hypothetical protein
MNVIEMTRFLHTVSVAFIITDSGSLATGVGG